MLLYYLRSSIRRPDAALSQQDAVTSQEAIASQETVTSQEAVALQEAVTAQLTPQADAAAGNAPRPAGGCVAWCKRVGRRLVPESWPRQAMTTVKILIGYMQMIGVFSRIHSIHWPSPFNEFINLIDWVFSKFLRITAFIDELLMRV